jgi:uncharacterized protein YacL (UPF0231 family)
MNYQFVSDIEGTPQAEFEMGFELFTQWFCDEIGTDTAKITELKTLISQLQDGAILEHIIKGNTLTMILNQDEIEITADSLQADIPDADDMPEGTEISDDGCISGCGLADFVSVLDSWEAFVG